VWTGEEPSQIMTRIVQVPTGEIERESLLYPPPRYFLHHREPPIAQAVYLLDFPSLQTA
jgi:hypothetical protein